MALQVWLPLTKDTRNQGLSNVTVTNTGATFNSAGKLGGCYNFNNSAIGIGVTNVTLGNTFSIACWIKVNSYNSDWANAFKIYKDSYDYIGLCMNQTSASTKQLGFHIYKNNGSNARTSVSDAYYMPLTVGTWYHLCFVVTPSEVKTYQNGVNIRTGSITTTFPSVSNYNLGLGKSSLFGGLDCSMNDFRLYNHALSQMEVKELAKGLVLHYPLNRNGWGQENLVMNTSIMPVHSSALKGFRVSGTGVLSHVTYNNLPVGSGAIRLTNNTSAAASCGMAQDGLSGFVTGKKYSQSCWVRANANNTITNFYLQPIWISSSQTTGVDSGRYTLTTEWQQIKAENLTLNGEQASTYSSGYCYCTIPANGWIEVCGMKVEESPIVTPWCPNSSDELATTLNINGTTEYDCSGFEHNGTRTGTFTWTSDTPKYEVSTVFDASHPDYIKIPYANYATQGAQAMTWSIWAYDDDWSTYSGRIYSCTEGGGVNIEDSGSTTINWAVNMYTAADQSTYAYQGYCTIAKSSLSAGWHMFTWVYTTTGTKVYVDGVLASTYNITSYGLHFANTALYLGAEAQGETTSTGYYLTGKLSDFRIYATALSATDVAELYKSRNF